MFQIVKKRELNSSITLMEIAAPYIARKAMPGQFIIFRVDEMGERVPLTIADFANARELAAATLGKAAEDVTIAEWISTCAICDLFDDGAVDIVFKRSMDGACFFLNRELGECRAHKHRSLVCQTHCCLPKTELAERLRAEAINCGEDELVRRLLMSEDCPEHLAECRVEDYAENGFSAVNPEDWRGIPLKTIVSDELWQLLLADMQA